MELYSRLFLIGPMGGGKTTVGKMLADRFRCGFRDSDAEIEKNAGADVSTLFERVGESEFRRLEEQAIETLTCEDGIVLATGGGAVLSQRNRELMTSRGTVVYLDADVEAQLARVTASLESRPMLYPGDPHQILKKLYYERKPLYEQIADVVVVTTNVPLVPLVDKILSALGEYWNRG